MTDPITPSPQVDIHGNNIDPLLAGQVAVLTGASSGLGRHLAKTLARAGATVVVVARREALLRSLAEEIGSGCDPIVHDVTDLERADRLMAHVHEYHGRIDILVNNAGVTHVGGALREPIDRLREVMCVNVLGPLALSQAAARRMRGYGGGVIVNVASVIGLTSVPVLPQASYAASKGAMVALTRELAVQWARYGIRVNALAPGLFPSEMTAGLDGDSEGPLAGAIPLGRSGALRELDGPLLFLVSAASSYVTGQVLVVDGGLISASGPSLSAYSAAAENVA